MAVGVSQAFFILLILDFFCISISFDLKFFTCRKQRSLPMLLSKSTNEEIGKLKVLGVCGGIGSGKSSACKLLVSSLGCVAHLDADSIAHSVYSPGTQAVKDVVAEFGTKILQDGTDDTIDRKKLGPIVFADRSKMAKLEEIVWPHVKDSIKLKIDDLQSTWAEEGESDKGSNEPIIILEAAILLDAGWDDLMDGVWAVVATKEIALERIMARNNLSREEAEKRIIAQESRRGIGNLEEEKEKGKITAIIENNGTLDDLKEALQNTLSDPKSWN